jgi:hypothetical protein
MGILAGQNHLNTLLFVLADIADLWEQYEKYKKFLHTHFQSPWMQSTGFAGRCNEHDARTYFDWQRTLQLLFFENITFLGDSCTYSNPESSIFYLQGNTVHQPACYAQSKLHDGWRWVELGPLIRLCLASVAGKNI